MLLVSRWAGVDAYTVAWLSAAAAAVACGAGTARGLLGAALAANVATRLAQRAVVQGRGQLLGLLPAAALVLIGVGRRRHLAWAAVLVAAPPTRWWPEVGLAAWALAAAL
jgi:hypothetical protein